MPAVHDNNMDVLCSSLLNAIKPCLKAPLTAVLCSPEELTITKVSNNGEYNIVGYVNSQNSYGALIKTDVTATAIRLSDGTWVIGKTTVGVQTSKNNAKNFFVNYIVLSIFTGIMGLLGYYILKLVVR